MNRWAAQVTEPEADSDAPSPSSASVDSLAAASTTTAASAAAVPASPVREKPTTAAIQADDVNVRCVHKAAAAAVDARMRGP